MELNPDGSGGRRLTNGAADKVVHRYCVVAADDEGIDPDAGVPVAIRPADEAERVRPAPQVAVERLMLDECRGAARSAPTRSTCSRLPANGSTIRRTGSSATGDLRGARQVSATNPFQKDFAWGRSELVSYRTVAGSRPARCVALSSEPRRVEEASDDRVPVRADCRRHCISTSCRRNAATTTPTSGRKTATSCCGPTLCSGTATRVSRRSRRYSPPCARSSRAGSSTRRK